MANTGGRGLLATLWQLVQPRQASAEVVAGDPTGAKLLKRMATGPVPTAWRELYDAAQRRPEQVVVYGKPASHDWTGLPANTLAAYWPLGVHPPGQGENWNDKLPARFRNQLAWQPPGRKIQYYEPPAPIRHLRPHPLQTLAHELTHFLSDVTGSQPFQGHRQGEEALAEWGEQPFRPREEWPEFPEAPMNLYIRMLQRLTRPAGR